MHSLDRKHRPISEAETERRAAQSAENKRRNELLSRDEIERDYKAPTRRWLELAALTGDGPPMVRIGARMIRYQRGAFEDWLAARTVRNTSEEVVS